MPTNSSHSLEDFQTNSNESNAASEIISKKPIDAAASHSHKVRAHLWIIRIHGFRKWDGLRLQLGG
jgi:hypothetical protein